MTIAELTDKLSDLYRAGRRYQFLRHAHLALAQTPAAPELAALTLRALIEQGLGGPARELWQLRVDLRSATPDADSVQAALATLPHGRVPWSACADIYAGNAEALCAARPELAHLLDRLPDSLTDVQLFQTHNGRLHLSRRHVGKLREWLPDLSSTDDEAELRLPQGGQIAPFALIGLRVGNIPNLLLDRTANLLHAYGHPLYIVEPDETRFAAWMHAADHTALLRQQRVFIFVGPDAVRDMQQVLQGNSRLQLPQLFVDQGEAPETATAVQQLAEAIHTQRIAELERRTAALAALYRGCDAAYWAEHLRPPGPVLAVTSRFTTVLQYTTRDALAALRAMGYETHMVIEECDHEVMSHQSVCAAIERVRPALILLLDHLRYESPCLPDNIPLLTWIQDPLPNLMCRRAGDSIGTMDFVCGILKGRCVDQHGYPPERFVTLDNPVCTSVFHDGPIDDAAQARYACDVCFVSNASTPLPQLHAEALGKYPAEYHPLLERLYAEVHQTLAQHAFPYDHGLAMTRAAAEQVGAALAADALRNLVNFYTYRMLDWGRRQQTLEWVGDWARRTGRVLRIYGQGWERHPTLAPFAAGAIEHGEPLRQALRAARLALQLIPSGFRHQRSYEVLAAGTLPLTRYAARDFGCPTLAEHLRRRDAGEPTNCDPMFPGLERIAFETPEQFAELAERYLHDPAAYARVRDEYRQIVLTNFSYASALRKVMDAFQATLAASAETNASAAV